MPLETATYINQLTVTNPAASDGLNNADDHLRMIKAALKATFSGFTGAAVTATEAQINAAVAQAAGTAVSTIPLGTALLPGLTPLSDPNTGLWSSGADQLDFSVNGVNQFHLTSTDAVFAGNLLSATLTAGAVSATTLTATTSILGPGSVPVGATVLWWTNTLPSDGCWIWANAAPVSRSTYAPLFSLWGTTFGAGDGSTTFGVPDLREVVPLGKSTMGGAAARGFNYSLSGAITVLNAVIGLPYQTLTTAQMPAHSHTGLTGFENQAHDHGYGYYQGIQNMQVGGNSLGTQFASGTTGTENQNHNHYFTTDPTGSNAAHEIVQPSGVVNYIIRAK